jgi:hypothetical protein
MHWLPGKSCSDCDSEQLQHSSKHFFSNPSSAHSYSGQLKMRKAFFIPESEFHVKKPDAPTYGSTANEPSATLSVGASLPSNATETSTPSSGNANTETPIVLVSNGNSGNHALSHSSRDMTSNGNLTTILTKDLVIKKEIKQEPQTATSTSAKSSPPNHRESSSGARKDSSNCSLINSSNSLLNSNGVQTVSIASTTHHHNNNNNNSSSGGNNNSSNNNKGLTRDKPEEEVVERSVKSERTDSLSKLSKRAEEKFAARAFERINNSSKSEGRLSAASSPKHHGRSNDESDSQRDRDHRDRRRKESRVRSFFLLLLSLCPS